MVRKTRKHQSTQSKKFNGIQTIPELRRSFEHIEGYLDDKLNSNETKEKKVIKKIRIKKSNNNEI